MAINMSQKDIDTLVSLFEPNKWNKQIETGSLVRPDIDRNVLYIINHVKAHTRKRLDREKSDKQNKYYIETFKPNEFIVDRIIIDPHKNSILLKRSDSVFVISDVNEKDFLDKLNLDWEFEDNSEISFEEIST